MRRRFIRAISVPKIKVAIPSHFILFVFCWNDPFLTICTKSGTLVMKIEQSAHLQLPEMSKKLQAHQLLGIISVLHQIIPSNIKVKKWLGGIYETSQIN